MRYDPGKRKWVQDIRWWCQTCKEEGTITVIDASLHASVVAGVRAHSKKTKCKDPDIIVQNVEEFERERAKKLPHNCSMCKSILEGSEALNRHMLIAHAVIKEK